jgi:hypothetical protein
MRLKPRNFSVSPPSDAPASNRLMKGDYKTRAESLNRARVSAQIILNELHARGDKSKIMDISGIDANYLNAALFLLF